MTKRELLKEALLREFPHLGEANADYAAERNKSRFKSQGDELRDEIEDGDKVELIAAAYARHYYTDYETRLSAVGRSEEAKRAARREIRPLIERILLYWRTGEGEAPKRVK